MLDVDQDFSVGGLVDTGPEGLAGGLDFAVLEKPDQHERRVLGDIEGVVDLLAGDAALKLGKGFLIDVIESRHDLVLELEEVRLLLRALAAFGKANDHGMVGADREHRRGEDFIGRAIEDVFEGTHLVMLSVRGFRRECHRQR